MVLDWYLPLQRWTADIAVPYTYAGRGAKAHLPEFKAIKISLKYGVVGRYDVEEVLPSREQKDKSMERSSVHTKVRWKNQENVN